MPSRQAAWQRKQKAMGNCSICGKPAIQRGAWFCHYHLARNRAYNRTKYRLAHGIPLDAPLYTRAKV